MQLDPAVVFAGQPTTVSVTGSVIQPGDLVENHCVYDSTERTEPTYGGLGTFDEMCWNEMMYYPRENINFDLCGN